MKRTRTASKATVIAKPSFPVAIPIRELDDLESLALGFRQDMISCEHGGVAAGAGLGNDWISIDWKGRHFAVRGKELLAAVVGTYDAKEARDISNAIVHEAGVQAAELNFSMEEGTDA